MDMNTTNRNTYVKYANPERAQLFDPYKNSETTNLKTNATPMQSVTQSKSDFVFHQNFQRTKPANVDPYMSDLDRQIYPHNM